MSRLTLCPVDWDTAKSFVNDLHRHHKSSVGWKYGVGAAVDSLLVAVAIVGRPVARGLQDGWTLEVLRLCVDETQAAELTKNACSMLYGAVWRAAKAMGYRRMVTYTLDSESGASLRAAGWIPNSRDNGGGSWDTPSRRRTDKAPTCQKVRWEPPDSDSGPHQVLLPQREARPVVDLFTNT